MSPPMELDSPTLRDPVQHYRMMPRDPPPPRRELPPITPQGGGGYGPPDMIHHQIPDRYPQTHHSRGGGGMMDFSDQEYSDRAAWERGMVPSPEGPPRRGDRDYYMDDVDPQMKMRMDDRGGGMPPMDYNGRYLPPEMREMREIHEDSQHHEDMRGHHPHDRDYPSPYRGQTMVHRDIL